MILGILGLLAIFVGIVVLTALAVAAIIRDPKRGSSSLGAAMLEVQSILEPSKKHSVRVVRADETESEAESGDPPS